MLLAPQIDPVIVALGPIQIRWYSMMYVIGLMTVYAYFRHGSRTGTLRATYEQIESLMMAGLIGMILGARTFYVFLYNWDHYKNHLGDIIAVWKGGLSFHGAITGICAAILIYCIKQGISFFNVMDHICLSAPVGLFFGRIGNFINGELWGRVTDAPWGMVFPEGGPLPRHPSQLYESFGEGLVLLGVLHILRLKNPKVGVISGAFLIGYGVIRFIIEFFREPDQQLGFILGPFSMGQLLCAIMIAFGAAIIMAQRNGKEQFTPGVQATASQPQ